MRAFAIFPVPALMFGADPLSTQRRFMMKQPVALIALAAILGFGTAGCGDTGSSTPSDPPKQDTSPGPSFQTLQGKLTQIDGDFYVVKDFEGREHRVHVGKDTKMLTSQPKKPGDSIRAEVTKGMHANSIQ